MTEPKWYDATASKVYDSDINKVIAKLEPLCERFVIGDEEGSTGYEHWQIRMVFKVGKTLQALVNLQWGWHWSPTQVRNFDYCEKEGRYYRSWEKDIAVFATIELRTWQKAVLEDLEDQDTRQITYLYDEKGGHGKTYLSKYIVATHKGVYCPVMVESADYMAFALAHKNSSCFVFDLPRAEDCRKSLWSALESIKNGYFWDKRNSWREAWVKPPKVLVISNDLPDWKALSRDRWRVYEIVDWGEDVEPMLLPIVAPQEEGA